MKHGSVLNHAAHRVKYVARGQSRFHTLLYRTIRAEIRLLLEPGWMQEVQKLPNTQPLSSIPCWSSETTTARICISIMARNEMYGPFEFRAPSKRVLLPLSCYLLSMWDQDSSGSTALILSLITIECCYKSQRGQVGGI